MRWSTFILTGINFKTGMDKNHMPIEMWDEIIYLFHNRWSMGVDTVK